MTRSSAYKRLMDKRTKQCNIVYVTQRDAAGWMWQAVLPEVKTKLCAEVYGLFYECVLAARACGYTPATPLKCS